MERKHQTVYVQIGLNILYYRKQRGLTQEQLAERAAYSRNHIQQIETAVTAPSLDALLDIADALEIPVQKLLEIR
jgi:transcriptional regulator with XRE-family HTH domain